jgi:hypothetical protein
VEDLFDSRYQVRGADEGAGVMAGDVTTKVRRDLVHGEADEAGMEYSNNGNESAPFFSETVWQRMRRSMGRAEARKFESAWG